MHLLPQYIHVVNPKLKHIYLSFDEEGNLIIKSAKISTKQIEQLLLKKASWINKAKYKIQTKKGKVIDFKKSPTLYFLGKLYTIHLVTHDKKKTSHTINDSSFIITYYEYNESIFQKHIDLFYKNEAKKYIPLLIEQWSIKMNLPYKKISFRKTKRQWGSCSSSNHLSFNTMMMKLPKNVIEYIIVHELAHIKYKHHQKDFWGLVANYIPDYKEHIKILNQYST